MRRHRPIAIAAVLVACVLAGPPAAIDGLAAADLPARLTDAEFWALSNELSEPDGIFQSDNLLSNEMVFGRIVPDLVAKTKPDGVYVGVGPEQNFTYIAAMRPRMVFIPDIRRGNLHLQLMYKALFELSGDRADFVSRLFSKKRPEGLISSSSAMRIFDAFWGVPTIPEAEFLVNLQAIQTHLTKTRSIPLSKEDLDGIAGVYRTFYWYGPVMSYAASTALRPVPAGRGISYADLMTQVDGSDKELGYLASEEKFQFLKELERRNMVVPVVGNFAGPKALRAIGDYVRKHGAVISAFYVSNVEMYLRQNGIWQAFCANVATMPLDEASVFIRPGGGGFSGSIRFVSPNGVVTTRLLATPPRLPGSAEYSASNLIPMMPETKGCASPIN